MSTISDLFDKKYLDLSYPEFLKACHEMDIKIIKEQITQVERDSVTQAKGNSFFRHRAARLTNPAMPSHSFTLSTILAQGAADTLIILSIIRVASSCEPLELEIKKSIDRNLDNIEKFRRRRPITLSTWMRTFAIPLVFSTSTGSSWSFPSVKVVLAERLHSL